MKHTWLIAILAWGCVAPEEATEKTTETEQGLAIVEDTPRHVAVGVTAACFINFHTTGPNLWCFGSNSFGQVGDGTTSSTAIKLIGSKTWTQVSGGWGHMCAIDDAKNLYCWGTGPYGELGLGATTQVLSPTLVGSGYLQVTTGWRHTCALKDGSGDSFGNTQLYCWGYNGDGELGLGDTTHRTVPTATIHYGTQVSAGAYHTCFTRRTQTGSGSPRFMKCAGWNSAGQLGDNTYVNRTTFVDFRDSAGMIPAFTQRITRIGGGYNHTCVYDQVKGLVCWGDNTRGQLAAGYAGGSIPYFNSATGLGYSTYPHGGIGASVTLSADYYYTRFTGSWVWGLESGIRFGGMGVDFFDTLGCYGKTTAPCKAGVDEVRYVGDEPGTAPSGLWKYAAEIDAFYDRSCKIYDKAPWGGGIPGSLVFACDGPSHTTEPYGSSAWTYEVQGSIKKTISY